MSEVVATIFTSDDETYRKLVENSLELFRLLGCRIAQVTSRALSLSKPQDVIVNLHNLPTLHANNLLHVKLLVERSTNRTDELLDSLRCDIQIALLERIFSQENLSFLEHFSLKVSVLWIDGSHKEVVISKDTLVLLKQARGF